MTDANGGSDSLWVFGYGSLMWNPGFPYAERHRARLPGYARRFRLLSVHYRGTPECPGLVLGLDAEPAAGCVGVAYRVAPKDVAATLAYLHEREMITYAYRETRLAVEILGADDSVCSEVAALCYVLDRAHAQYAGELPEAEMVARILQARGVRGENREYVTETLRQLEQLGVHEEELVRLGQRLAVEP